MQAALAQWHCPAAGDEIADRMLAAVGVIEPLRPLPRSINLRPIPLTTNPRPATASAEAVAEPAFARELPRPEPASV